MPTIKTTEHRIYLNELGSKIRRGDKKAIALIKRAFRLNDGCLRAAADYLQCSERCLNNWVREPALKKVLKRNGREANRVGPRK